MSEPNNTQNQDSPEIPSEVPPIAEFDDTLQAVPETNTDAPGGTVVSAFMLTRLQALEKPRLEEELIEPDGGSSCGCNSVCACVPVETCACNQVCTCDSVESCHSYSSGCYGGGGGYGGYYAPCH